MNRDELVEVVCRFVHSDSESGGLRRTCPTGQAIVDAVEPLIRADERKVMLAARHYERADLRAKVEALRANVQYDTAGNEIEWLDRDSVLALIDEAP